MSNYRKNWLINREFQFKFTGLFILCGILNFVFLIGAVNWYFHKIKQQMTLAGFSAESSIQAYTDAQLFSLNMILFIIATFATFLMFSFGMWLSNKAAGPVYRVTEDLNNLNGDSDKKIIKIREGDFFLELQDAVNAYIERIHPVNKTKMNDKDKAQEK